MSIGDSKVAQGVTLYQFTFTRYPRRSSVILMRKLDIAPSLVALLGIDLRYNELKTAILHVLTTEGWCDSNRIIQRTRSELGLSVSCRAVRMALLRYHRYGLLHREWRRGEYAYRLSDRGARRLVWLRGLAASQSASPADSETPSGLGRPGSPQ